MLLSALYAQLNELAAISKMYTHGRHLQDPEIQELRRQGGLWLKKLRERQGLSQRALANLVDAEYYTFISQLETGRGRIPPDRYQDWAAALGVPTAEFVRTVMKYYDPVTYRILFRESARQRRTTSGVRSLKTATRRSR